MAESGRSGYRQCPQCSKWLKSEKRTTCPHCGHRFEPQAWNCPTCNTELQAGSEICWACGIRRDGTPDPDFKVEAAPIVEVDHANPPSLWIALICFPAWVFCGLVQMAFPLKERSVQSVVRPLVVIVILVLLAVFLFRLAASP